MIKMNQTFKLSPGYISGLTQSDGSFFCSIIISKRHRFGLQFRPKFTITADLNSKYVLDSIQSYFNCGILTVNNKNFTAEYEVVKLEDLFNIIIPHFKQYPVFCAKLHAFNLFVEIVSAMYNKEKRTLEGRRELLKMALSMNVSSNRKEDRLDLLFNLLGCPFLIEEKDKILIPNTIFTIDTPVTDDNIAGIIDGDGSVYISFQKNGDINTGFSITTDKLSMPLLEQIKKRLNDIGSIRKGTKDELVYSVTGLNQKTETLIPFIDKNPLFSERSQHYDKFRTITLLLRDEQPLSLDSKIKIVELAYNMNKEGKHRNLTKEQYLEILRNKKKKEDI